MMMICRRWSNVLRWIILTSSVAIRYYEQNDDGHDFYSHHHCRTEDDNNHNITVAPLVVVPRSLTASFDCATSSSSSSSSLSHGLSALEQARQLVVPQVTSTMGGELEHVDFWSTHAKLLRLAWNEWEQEQQQLLLQQSSSSSSSSKNLLRLLPLQVESSLQQALDAVWNHPRSPETESALRTLLTPVVEFDHGGNHNPKKDTVYQFQLFSESTVYQIRQRLDAAHKSGIPLRRPNGMNRHGLVLDSSSSSSSFLNNNNNNKKKKNDDNNMDGTDGACTDSVLLEWQEELIKTIVRPMARLLFPEYVRATTTTTDDDDDDDDDDLKESYGFTIRYQKHNETGQGDVKLNEHADASVVTLNVNLNLPNDNDNNNNNSSSSSSSFEGSSLYFVDPQYPNSEEEENDNNNNNINSSTAQHHHHRRGRRQYVSYTRPGQALLHRGQIRHGTLPILSGERYNYILWLFGAGGYVRIVPYPPQHHEEEEQQQQQLLLFTLSQQQ
jgi:hypothetical protein